MLRSSACAVALALSLSVSWSMAQAQAIDLDAPLQTQGAPDEPTVPAGDVYVEPKGLGVPEEDAEPEERRLPEERSERKMLRTCVESFAADPEVLAVGTVGEFCGCYVQEILDDREENPDLYASSDATEKKKYYSSKEEEEKKASVLAAFAGHERYCLKLLE